MSIEQRAKDMWVSDLVKEIKKLRKENEDLKVRVDDLQPNYTTMKMRKRNYDYKRVKNKWWYTLKAIKRKK